jgi:hypothetical protein
MPILFAETAGSLSTSSGFWAPIPGLAFTLPAGQGKTALLILNLPNPYATGNDFPGGEFAISVNGSMLVPIAVFTYDSQTPQSTGRKPTTLVVKVPLHKFTQPVEALWQNVRGSNVVIDTPSSLSAIIM